MWCAATAVGRAAACRRGPPCGKTHQHLVPVYDPDR
jgi:hypothetical protein